MAMLAGIAGIGVAGVVGSGLLDGHTGGGLSAVLQAARDWEARYRQITPGN